MRIIKGLSVAMVSAIALVCAGNAQATTTVTFNTVTSAWGSSAPTADIERVGPGTDISWNNIRISPSEVNATINTGSTSTTLSLLTWCVDIFQVIKPGTYGVTTLADYIGDSTKANAIAALITHEGLSKVSASHDAAVQLALWEILYEDNATAPSFSTGIFEASDISSSVLSQAATFVQNSKTIWTPVAGWQLEVATSSKYQDQLFFNRSPVPEPASWMLMIVGFGMAGASLRRRQAKIAVTYS